MQECILDTDLIGENVIYSDEEKKEIQGIVRAIMLGAANNYGNNYIYFLVQSEDGSLRDIKAEHCKVV